MQDVKHTPAMQELPERAIKALVVFAVVLFVAILALAYQEHVARTACEASVPAHAAAAACVKYK